MWPFERKPQHDQQYVLESGTTRDSRLPVSLSGLPWDRVRIPPRNHLCWPQTKLVARTRTTYRCPCGGWSIDSGRTWFSRNSRKRLRRRGRSAPC